MKPLNSIGNYVNNFLRNRCVNVTLKTMILVRTSLRTKIMRTVEQFNKNHRIQFIKLILVWTIIIFLVASCTKPSYANGVHPHDELALVGYTYTSAYSPLRAFFMRKISMPQHIFMVKLERDTFECAGSLCCLSTNPFQLCHPHLVVNGKAPKQAQERINHA